MHTSRIVILTSFILLSSSRVVGQIPDAWSSMNGPQAGSVQCLVRAHDGGIYIGTDASGVYRSDDGLGWKWVGNGLGEQNITALAVEPDGDLLALTFVRPQPLSSHSPVEDSPIGHLYRSTDLGKTWTVVDTVFATPLLMVDGAGTIWRRYFFESRAVLYRSTNGGTSWTSVVPPFIGAPYVKTAALDSSGALYVSIRDSYPTNTVYRTTDNGGHWSTLVSDVAPDVLSYSRWGYLFGSSPSLGVVRVKTDGSGYTVLDPSWDATSFAFPGKGMVFATGSDGSVRRSTNNGVDWSLIARPETGARLITTPDGSVLYLMTESRRLLRSTDGGDAWTEVSGDLRNTFVPSLLCTPEGVLYAGTQAGIWEPGARKETWVKCYEKADGGSFPPRFVWAMTGGSAPFVAAALEVLAYSGGGANTIESRGGIASTKDGWSTVKYHVTGSTGGAPSPDPPPAPIIPLAAVTVHGDTVYVAGVPAGPIAQPIGRYHDGAYDGISGPLGGKTVQALTRNRHDTLFAGTLGHGVYRSGTHGTTWAVASGGLADLDVYALATDSSGRVFAGTGSGLFISTDRGTTWNAAEGFPSVRVQALATTAQGHVYVATTDFVWLSPAHGTSPWYRLNAGLPIADITSLAVGPDGTVYAGSWGCGVYRRAAWPEPPAVPALVYPANLQTDVPSNPVMRWRKVEGAQQYHFQLSSTSLFTTTVVDDSTLTDTSHAVTLPGAGTWYWRVRAQNVAGTSAFPVPWKFASTVTALEHHPDLPREFFLAQNHPNPFNPSTRIRYGLPERAYVRITVYSPLGQRVALLFADEQEAGYHEIGFDAQRLASGVYLYRMEAGSFVHVRKLVLVR